MLHVEIVKKEQNKCRMYWKDQAIWVLQTFSFHFWFSAILQLFADLHYNFTFVFFYFLAFFSETQSYILNAPHAFSKKINEIP